MELGISYWFGYPSFPQERIRLLLEAGFTSVSLHWTDEYEAVTGKKESISPLLYKNGIQISSFHLSFDDAHYLWCNTKQGEEYRSSVHKAIDDAQNYNVPVIIIHTDGEEYTPSRIHFLLDLVSYAASKNVCLCLENLQHEDNLENILQIADSTSLSLCYDIGHANIRNCPFDPVKDRRVKYLHIHDNFSINDSHLLPYTGNVDWEKSIGMIQKINMDVDGILEVHGSLDSYDEAKSYLECAAECRRTLLRKINAICNVREK